MALGTTAKRRSSVAVGLLGGIAGWLYSAPAAAFDPTCPFGVNAHQASNAALDQAAAAGIGWVRFDMNWFQFEPANDSYDWTIADRFTSHAASLGLNVFMTIAYTPSWAVGAPCNDGDANELNWCKNAPSANPSDFTGFVTAAVTRYGSQVKAWGMWNEPNLLGFYRGTRDQYVSDILVPGSNAVHAACGDCLVLGPELANLRSANWDADEGQCVGTACRFNGWNYSLSQILQVAAGSIDVVTHHKYKDPADLFWSQLTDGTYEVIKVCDGVKELTDAYAPGKPVWITEFGWEAEPYGSHLNSYAAAQLTASYEGLVNVMVGVQPGLTNQPWPELDKLFWYDLHDDPSGYSWGLLDAALAPKPQHGAYGAVIQALGDCQGPWSPPGSGGAGGGGASGGAGTGGDGAASAAGASAGGGSAAGGPGTGGASAPPGASSSADDGGCGCRTAGAPSGAGRWPALGLVGLAAWRRRRARSRVPR